MNIEDKNPDLKSSFQKGLITGLLICSLFALIFLFVAKGGIHPVQKQTETDQTSGDTQVSMNDIEKKLESLESLVDEYYYYSDDMDTSAIADKVYAAYIAGLEDKYSEYYTADEMQKRMESINGSYCGIGAVVSKNEDGEITIILPYENAPAANAGLQPGDIILSIDGTDLSGMELEQAVTLVKGEEGTSAVFKVRRGEEEFETTITRQQVNVPTMSYEMKEGNVGYIYISSFEMSTPEQYKNAIDDLLNQGAEGIVFDLRNNGGGALDAVIDMLDYILPEELLMYVEDKFENRKNYYSEAECIDETLPMAVIINGNSASASEVFTGALQDYGRAKIFGTKSYGKGVVQNLIPLNDGSGVKLTIAEYFTPLGRNFNNNGIDPDETVELPGESQTEAYDEKGYLKEGYDTQLNAAVSYIQSQIAEK